MEEKRFQRIGQEQWRKHIETQAGSGKSISAYCRKAGLLENSFYNWRKRLQAGKEAKFIQLDLERSATAVVIITTPNGYRVESSNPQICVSTARSLGQC